MIRKALTRITITIPIEIMLRRALRLTALVRTNEIKLSEIEVNPFQPRTDFDQDALQELADSIKLQGLIQPITVGA